MLPNPLLINSNFMLHCDLNNSHLYIAVLGERMSAAPPNGSNDSNLLQISFAQLDC